MTLAYRLLLAAGRAHEALTADPDLVVARQLDRLLCDEPTWVEVWKALSRVERGRVVRAGRDQCRGSLEARMHRATNGKPRW